MRLLLSSIALLACAVAPAVADALPAGWSQREDGAYVHQQSTVICPLELNGLKRAAAETKGAPDLGVCTYTSEQGLEGLIRVREYVPGGGETPLAIKNDQMLMEPPADGRMIVSTIRSGPGPERNGAKTKQIVFTFERNKLLIDCIGRQLLSDSSNAGFDFANACMKLQDVK